jgi:hypothetical protein
MTTTNQPAPPDTEYHNSKAYEADYSEVRRP